MQILLKLFHKLELEEALPNSFYLATITLIPKPHKDLTNKNKNKKRISEVLNKIFANKILEHIKDIIDRDQGSFIPEM